MSQQQTSAPPGAGDGLGPRQVGAILFITLMFLLTFLARLIFAPLLPAMEAELGMAHTASGSLFLFASLGYGLAILGSAWVASWLEHRRVILLSALGVSAALGMAAASSGVWGLRLGLFLIGAAGGLYLPSGVASITSLVGQGSWGRAMGIHELAPNLSFVIAPFGAELLLSWISWRGVLACLAVVVLTCGLAFGRWGRGGAFRGQAPERSMFLATVRLPAVWLLGLLIALGIGASLGVFTMLPLFLMDDHGFTRSQANLLLGLSRLSCPLVAFASGWVSDRLGPRRAMAWVLAVGGGLTLGLGLVPRSWVVLLVFLQPAVCIGIFPPAFAALSQVTPPQRRNLAVALAVMLAAALGGGMIPLALGALGDHHLFGAGIALVGGMLWSGLLLVARLRLPE